MVAEPIGDLGQFGSPGLASSDLLLFLLYHWHILGNRIHWAILLCISRKDLEADIPLVHTNPSSAWCQSTIVGPSLLCRHFNCEPTVKARGFTGLVFAHLTATSSSRFVCDFLHSWIDGDTLANAGISRHSAEP
jgi:hypothetical protein